MTIVLYIGFSAMLAFGVGSLILNRKFGEYLEEGYIRRYPARFRKFMDANTKGFQPRVTAGILSSGIILISALALASIDEISNLPS